ncbi:hypothetical protein FB45DRAFT_907677 [Roridomyces roridus]|uniref:Cyanovirin-N domain-containing protein n=1 Tax=Roridomyces roridus TaxID=1738132 RepID=A0AAD7C2I0_9AGAR|nr:hypothetical protein FB45DRAFT_907677 [Roridomyces roridus]
MVNTRFVAALLAAAVATHATPLKRDDCFQKTDFQLEASDPFVLEYNCRNQNGAIVSNNFVQMNVCVGVNVRIGAILVGPGFLAKNCAESSFRLDGMTFHAECGSLGTISLDINKCIF